MPYNPSLHTVSNKPIGLGTGVPTDARSYYYDEGSFSYRPYASTTEVLNYLVTGANRTGNFPIYIKTGNITDEYRFKDGVLDANLVLSGDTGAVIKTKLESLSGTSRLDASAIQNLPAATAPETGATIKTKLESLTGTSRLNATAIQGLPISETGSTIKSKLESLLGENRLDASAIKNINLLITSMTTPIYRATGPFKTDSTSGVIYGTPLAPITGNIIFDTTDAIDGTSIMIYHQSGTEPTFTGGTISFKVGLYDTAGLNEIYVLRGIGDRYTINIVSGAEVVTEPPAVTLSSISATASPTSINEGGSGSVITVMATYSDSSTANVTSSSTIVKISGPGTLSGVDGNVLTVAADTISANDVTQIDVEYIEGGITRTSTVNVAIVNTSAADTTPPSAPTNLTFSNIAQNSATASWTASTDNVGVAGYNLYVDTVKHNTSLITGTTYNITGLGGGITYNIEVRAEDAAGNLSTPASNTVTTTATATIYDNLSNVQLILDDSGLAVGANNSYGVVDGSGNVTTWKSIAPGPTGRDFASVLTAPKLNSGVVFDGTGMFQSANTSIWNFLNYHASGINSLKWTVHLVVEIATTGSEDALYGIMGNNAGTNANVGLSLAYDDRSTLPVNNKASINLTAGGGKALFTGDNNSLLPPNTLIVYTITHDGQLLPADRVKVFINGTENSLVRDPAITHYSDMVTPPTYALQLGAWGNNARPMKGKLRTVVLQSGLDGSPIRNQFMASLKTKYGIV